MPLNQAFTHALYSPEKQFKAPEARRAALDALVQAGEDISRFRQAILAHRDFWQGMAGLDLDGHGDNDQFINAQDVHVPITHWRYNARMERARDGLAENAEVAETLANCDRTSLASNLQRDEVKAVVGDWGGGQDHLSHERLQQFSRVALLVAKVRVATPEQVLALLQAQTADAWSRAANSLGYTGVIDNQYLREAMREVSAIYLREKLTDNALNLLVLAEDDICDACENYFRNNFSGVVFGSLQPDDLQYLRQQVGIRYLNSDVLPPPKLTQLAGSQTVEAFRHSLLALYPGQHRFVNELVTPATLELLREQCALRVLSQSITHCRDVKDLEALRAADTSEAIRQVLETHEALGLSGPSNLLVREALTTQRAVSELARYLNPALARAKIQTADADVLKAILEAPQVEDIAKLLKMEGALPFDEIKMQALLRAFDNFLAGSLESDAKELVTPPAGSSYADRLCQKLFPQNTNPTLQEYVQRFCQYHNNEVQMRQKAAESYIWHHAKHVSDEHLSALAGSKGPNEQQAAWQAVFPHMPPELQPTTECLNYVKAQAWVRYACSQDSAWILRFAAQLDVQDTNGNAVLNALPDDKKIALRAQVTEVLLSKAPLSRNLEVLANATTVDARRRALTAMGLPDTVVDAFSDADTAKFQTLARERLNGLRLEAVSRFGAAARPRLLALIEKIPEAERAAFWDDKKALKALVDARFPDEMERVHPAFKGARAEIDAVCDENPRLYRLTSLHNAPLASVLANLQISVNSEACEQINRILSNVHDWNDDTSFEAFAAAVHRACGQPGTLDAFKAALAVERQAMHAQRNHNHAALNVYFSQPLSNLDKHILDFFLGLPKTADLDDTHVGPGSLWHADGGLLTLFKNAKNLSELHAAVDKASWKGVLPPSCKDELTRARFEDFKRFERREKLRGPGFADELKVMQDSLKDLRTRQEAFAQSAKPLQYFDQFHPAYAFMPVFQGKARENARAMQSHFETLDADCDTIVTNLRLQIEQLENIRDTAGLQGLRPQQQKALNKLLQEAQAQENRARQLLNFYEGIQRKLRGDPRSSHPMVQKGVMQQLAELESGKRSTMVFSNCTVKDIKDTPDALKTLAGAPSGAAPLTTLSVNSGPFDFGEAKPLDDGMLREYTLASVASPSLEGRYAEQRAVAGVMPQTGEVVGHVTLTVTRFPKAGPQVTPEALHEARVEFAMTMASQMLASIDWTPSEHRPLYLKGSNAEEQKYLWTALRILGQNTPGRKFDEKAIKVVGPFKPSSEMGFFSHFSSTKKTFEAVMKPEDAERMEKFEAYQQAVSSPKRQEAIKKALEAFTGRAGEAIEDARDENVKNNPGSGA